MLLRSTINTVQSEAERSAHVHSKSTVRSSLPTLYIPSNNVRMARAARVKMVSR